MKQLTEGQMKAISDMGFCPVCGGNLENDYVAALHKEGRHLLNEQYPAAVQQDLSQLLAPEKPKTRALKRKPVFLSGL